MNNPREWIISDNRNMYFVAQKVGVSIKTDWMPSAYDADRFTKGEAVALAMLMAMTGVPTAHPVYMP